jgi:signal recognition particle subunit SRP54
MVLEALGGKIARALQSLANQVVVDEDVLEDALKQVSRALLEADVNVKQVSELRQRVKSRVRLAELPPGANRRRLIQRAVFDELCRMLDPGIPAFQPQRGQSNVIMFVGLQGNGKTTSCVKVAYFYKRKGYQTGLVCADTFRAGAFDQLRQNATRARVPFFGRYGETDAVKVASEGVERFRREGFEIIIVDTSGRHKQETALFAEMEQLDKALEPDHIIFVMDGSIGQAAFDQARAFRQRVRVGSVILTKMDGHARGGGALSAVAATHSPIVFLGTGEHLDDLEAFQVQSFVGRLLGLGDVRGLVSTIAEANLENPDEEQMSRISQGILTLRDMQMQYANVLRLGPLSKVASMMPGMAEMLPKGSEKEAQTRVRNMLVILDSMNRDELDNTSSVRWDDSRKRRIARGSGRSIQEVEEVLNQYKVISKAWSRMGKNMKHLLQTTHGSAGHGMNLNSMPPMGAMEQQMQRMMDPRMLQQLGGGPGGIQRMMQQFMSGRAGMAPRR